MQPYWQDQLGLRSDFIASDLSFKKSLRKITDEATNRMLTRNAQQQYKEAMNMLNKEDIPDADDSSIKRFT